MIMIWLKKALNAVSAMGRRGIVLIVTPDDYTVLYSMEDKEKREAFLKDAIEMLKSELEMMQIIDGDYHE